MLRQIDRHRFLHSRQIVAVTPGSGQHVLRRLQRLFHHGYVDRPRAQLHYFSADGSRPLVYALTQAGAQAIAETGRSPRRLDNSNVKQLYLQHTLLVADAMLALEKACHDPLAPQLVPGVELAPAITAAVRPDWKVSVRDRQTTVRVGLVPDGLFVLAPRESSDRVLCFVEADRATMPIRRRSLHQTSVWRKLLAYAACWEKKLPAERYGIERMRVLVVTTTSQRAARLAAVCRELPRGHGLFLFTDIATLRNLPDVFRPVWLDGRGRPAAMWEPPRSPGASTNCET
ncbi:MAG: replication-relaxation family protein [Verrucomicrobia bacterium]|nr:replication-relaxation family protein [Verrucomicrobiota bacterium]